MRTIRWCETHKVGTGIKWDTELNDDGLCPIALLREIRPYGGSDEVWACEFVTEVVLDDRDEMMRELGMKQIKTSGATAGDGAGMRRWVSPWEPVE